MRAAINAKVRFLETKEGGRSGPTTKDLFRCVFVMDHENNDCVLILGDDVRVAPGQTVEVPIAFLCPDLVTARLAPGKQFVLREVRTIAEGEVLELLNSEV